MLFWTKLNPTVKQISTKKKFFGKYLHKVNIWCPASRIILNTNNISATELLKIRLELEEVTRSYNYGGSWYNHRSQQRISEIKNHAREQQLQYFINVKNQYKDQIKIRVEEPHLSIYCNDDVLLYNLVAKVFPERVLEIHSPITKEAEEVLNRGEIIIKKLSNYSYKVVFKEQMINGSVKQNINDYLYNLHDDVKIPKFLIRNLSNNNHNYFGGGYFYCKDINITTFLNLICPNLIAGIYKLTKLEH